MANIFSMLTGILKLFDQRERQVKKAHIFIFVLICFIFWLFNFCMVSGLTDKKTKRVHLAKLKTRSGCSKKKPPNNYFCSALHNMASRSHWLTLHAASSRICSQIIFYHNFDYFFKNSLFPHVPFIFILAIDWPSLCLKMKTVFQSKE